MNRLECVGKSSKVPAKDAVAVKPGTPGLRDAAENISVLSKTQSQKPIPVTQSEGTQPSVFSNGGMVKGNSDRMMKDPTPNSEILGERQDYRRDRIAVQHTASRSETCAVLQNLSTADIELHGQDRSPKQSPPVDVGTEATPTHPEEDKSVSADGVERIHEPVLYVSQNLVVPKCPSSQSVNEADNRDVEECEEDEDTPEFCAPIELLAEFLKAVMEKNYTLAKKLCQMILIYEPENPEAKHFLPLIEERLLLEEAQQESSCENNSSDDTDKEVICEHDDEDDESQCDDDDDDDEDNEDADSTDSDDSTDSSSSSLD